MSTSLQTINLPFDQHDDIDACCPSILIDALNRRKGVYGAHLDTNRHRLTLDYDPDVVDAATIIRFINSVGTKLESHYEDCVVYTDRPLSTRCNACRYLESRLASTPGVTGLSVNASAGVLHVTYRADQTSPGNLERAVLELQETLATPLPKITLPSSDKIEAAFVVLTLVGLISGVASHALGSPPWIVATLAAFTYFTGGIFGLIEGIKELAHFSINVDLLMILAAVGAALVGAWPEGATLLFLFSLSNVLQNYALDRSRKAIKKLLDLRPKTALVKRNGTEIEVPIEDLAVGETVVIKPGELIPVDGVILRGQSAIDQASITGESIPVDKRPGDQVFAATVNQHGALEVSVGKLAADSTLAKIIDLVEQAQAKRAPTQRWLDTFEQYYAMLVIGATALMIAVPVLFLGAPFESSFYRAMVLLVVASPCALVISTPASILSAIANAARKGILFKGGTYLEGAASLRVVAFDKTGTLTYGRPRVTEVVTLNNTPQSDLLGLAVAAEARSEHPIALAIVEYCEAHGVVEQPLADVAALPGMGVAGSQEGQKVLIGNSRLFESEGIPIPSEVYEEYDQLQRAGKTTLLVFHEGWKGIIGVSDEIRVETKEAIQRLRTLGIERIVMLTGDNQEVAAQVARSLELDDFFADLLPADKVTVVEQLQKAYGSVAMVGDGVNDAPALATASIGIAMGAAGTDVALETADVVLMADDISRLPYIIELSKRTKAVVWQNIAFSLSVIVLLIISNFLVHLPLPLGVVGHEGSTVIVVFNGLRLLAFRERD